MERQVKSVSKIAEFLIANIRTIGVIYAIGAGIAFVAVMGFFAWVSIEERKDRKKHPDEYDFDELDAGAATKEILLIGFIMAIGCAIVWWGIPILFFGLWVYAMIDEKFPQLTGTAEIDKETEE